MNYEKMSEPELRRELDFLSGQFEHYRLQNLNLNMARGVPSPEQLDLSLGLNDTIRSREDCFAQNGTDCRTYAANLFTGVPELRRLFSDVFGVPEDYIIIGGNSSLNMIYDVVARMMLFGVPGGDGPWFGKRVKFLCPSPGYDRHFKILESFGIELVTVAMTPDGPDMDAVEDLVKDPAVRGLICVPKFSNPTGVVFPAKLCTDWLKWKLPRRISVSYGITPMRYIMFMRMFRWMISLLSAGSMGMKTAYSISHQPPKLHSRAQVLPLWRWIH